MTPATRSRLRQLFGLLGWRVAEEDFDIVVAESRREVSRTGIVPPDILEAHRRIVETADADEQNRTGGTN
ncbi:MAG TPA: hypothetical protein VMW87_03525 [Spirochaetia bacterium]|nr:hypothetical protein [Spirochaetia bacterium]